MTPRELHNRVCARVLDVPVPYSAIIGHLSCLVKLSLLKEKCVISTSLTQNMMVFKQVSQILPVFFMLSHTDSPVPKIMLLVEPVLLCRAG